MSARELITKHLDLWTGAVTKKASSGRGSNGKVEPTGVKKLRELILNLAVRGKLVPQNSDEPTAASLLVDIEVKKKDLHHAKTIKKPKKVSPPQGDEIPWSLPSCWEWVRLPYIYYPISPSGKKLKSSETLETGQFPVVDQGQSYISGYTDDASLVIEIPHPVIVFGDHTTARKYIDFNFVPGADGTKILCPILVNPRFFYLQLLGYDLENRGYARHFKVLNENFFALPSLEEQHRIVQKVDELMGLCDRLEQQTSDQLEAHETLVDTLLGTLTQSENATELADNWARLAAHFDTLFTTEQSIDKLKQSILQLAVMGRLVEQKRGKMDTKSLLNEIALCKNRLIDQGKQKKQKTLPPISEEEKTIPIPASWEWVRLQDVIDVRDGTHDSPKSATGPDTYPLVTSKDFRDGQIDFSNAKRISEEDHRLISQRSLVEPDDILFSMIGGNIGNQIIVNTSEKFSVKNVALFKYYDKTLTVPRFLKIFTEDLANSLQDQASGGAQPFVSLGKLRSLPFPLAPVEEQHRIVQKVDELMALCDQLKERLNQASETRCQLAEAVVEGALKA